MEKEMFSYTKFIARYAETDQMGVVHHSVYPIWYEMGRTDLIKLAGFSYSELEKQGIMLPVLEVKAKYKSFCRYEDEITVESYVKGMTPVRITFGYNVYKNGEDAPINEGETAHAWTNRDLRPVNMRKYAPDVINKLYEVFKEET